jgi:translation initiation factor IF-1
MSKRDDLLEVQGTVTEVLPNNMFRVKLDEQDTEIICYTNGRLRQNKIKIILGDNVRLEMSVYDLTKGRITYRL